MDHAPISADREVKLFAEVILPLALPVNYTYRIPDSLSGKVVPGKRVAVQFGKSRLYSALVRRITDSFPSRYAPKEILEVLDDEPIVNDVQFSFWDWMASYYMCSKGEVMMAALPASLKLSSQTQIVLNRDSLEREVTLSENEALIQQVLQQQQVLSVRDVASLLNRKTVMPLIKSLLDKGIVYVSEQLSQGYRPRTAVYLQLDPAYRDTEKLKELYQLLEKAPRQLDALMTYMHLAKHRTGWVPKKDVAEESGVSSGLIQALIEKEVFHAEIREVSRLAAHETGFPSEGNAQAFSPAQERAYHQT